MNEYYKIASWMYTIIAGFCIIVGIINCCGFGTLLEPEDLQGAVFIMGSFGLMAMSMLTKLYGEKNEDQSED